MATSAMPNAGNAHDGSSPYRAAASRKLRNTSTSTGSAPDSSTWTCDRSSGSWARRSARAPSAYDLYKDDARIDAAIGRLAEALAAEGALDAATLAAIQAPGFALQLPEAPVDASHFIRALRLRGMPQGDARIRTTLDAALQRNLQQMLEDRLVQLRRKKVHHAAALVVDHETGDILAWAVAGGTDIDAVSAPRQPGSSLKPFLYAAALAKGWTAATMIEDAPISEAVGTGLHKFRNYTQIMCNQ